MPELTLSVELFVLILILVLGLIFDFINGFHDTANAIATVVATRVLSPGRAVLMAGVLNFVGALSGTAVATTVGRGIIPPELSTQALVYSAAFAYNRPARALALAAPQWLSEAERWKSLGKEEAAKKIQGQMTMGPYTVNGDLRGKQMS